MLPYGSNGGPLNRSANPVNSFILSTRSLDTVLVLNCEESAEKSRLDSIRNQLRTGYGETFGNGSRGVSIERDEERVSKCLGSPSVRHCSAQNYDIKAFL